MSKTEHSDSEFCYPGELSGALCCNYLLTAKQQKERLLSNQEIKKFITSQQQANTVKNTACNMNVFQRFLNESGEKRKVMQIFPEELYRLLYNFHITAKKKDNSR